MRPGLLEIGIIIAVILLVALVARIVQAGPDISEKGQRASRGVLRGESTGGAGRYLKLLGIALILAGILLILAGVSLFKWVFWSYLWSLIVIAIGLAMLFLFRKG